MVSVSRLIGDMIFGGLWISAWIIFIIGTSILFGDQFTQATQTLWIIAFAMLIAGSIINIIKGFIAGRGGGGKGGAALVNAIFLAATILLIVGAGVFGDGDRGSIRGMGIIFIVAGIVIIIASAIGLLRNLKGGREVLGDSISLIFFVLASIIWIIGSAIAIGANKGILIASCVLWIISAAMFVFGSFMKGISGLIAGDAED